MKGTISTRRGFLHGLAGSMVAPALLPGRLAAEPAARPLPALAPGQLPGEEFWELVRAQFPLRPGLTYMNAANLCPSPFVVSDAVTTYTRDIDADPSFQNRAKFSSLHERVIESLAAHIGASPDEVVVTRNTSESNNSVLNGLTLGRGDEVVIWDQNHPTNNVAWDVRAQRYGFTVTRVTTPARPQSRDDLLQPFVAAMTPRTRVLAVTHISSVSGMALPVGPLCAAARERNILSLVDGAQAFGFLDLDLHAMGCDFYTASAHKWFMGPKEAGLLYVRRELAPRIWPTVVGVGWDGAKDRGARRFSTLGQRDDAALVAVGAATAFHQRIGAAVIESRVRELAALLKRELAARVSGLQMHTPADPALSGGVVIFGVSGIEPRPGYDALYQKHNVAGATSGGSFPGIRLCPHVYTTRAEMARVAQAVAELRAM
jgi:selenocysteine lyase/cysteine desulfurase